MRPHVRGQVAVAIQDEVGLWLSQYSPSPAAAIASHEACCSNYFVFAQLVFAADGEGRIKKSIVLLTKCSGQGSRRSVISAVARPFTQ